MSKILLSIVEVFAAVIPELAFLQNVKLPRLPAKSKSVHPRDSKDCKIACSGQYRMFRKQMTYDKIERFEIADDGTRSKKKSLVDDTSTGFSVTPFSASVGAHLGVETKLQKIIFYVTCVLCGLDEHPASLYGTITGNASKWTRADAFERYSADLALYGHVPDALLEHFTEVYNRLMQAYEVERTRVIDEIKAERAS